MPTVDRGYELAIAIAERIAALTDLDASAARAPLHPRSKLTAVKVTVVCREEYGDQEGDRSSGTRRWTIDIGVQRSLSGDRDADIYAGAEAAAAVANLWSTDGDGVNGQLVDETLAGADFVKYTWSPRVNPALLFQFDLFTSVISVEYEAL